MARKFKSNRTDVRKKAKPVGGRKPAKKSGSNYKPPKRFNAKHSGYKATRKANEQLTHKPRCQCILGGRMVWVGAEDKHGKKVKRNGKVVRYPAIIIPEESQEGHRCDNLATVSRRKDSTSTEHKCAAHIGIWYVDENGYKRNYENVVIA